MRQTWGHTYSISEGRFLGVGVASSGGLGHRGHYYPSVKHCYRPRSWSILRQMIFRALSRVTSPVECVRIRQGFPQILKVAAAFLRLDRKSTRLNSSHL